MRRPANYIRITYSSVAYTMWMLIQDIRHLPLNELVEVLKNKLDDDAQKASIDGADSRGRGGLKALGVNQSSMRYIFHLVARVTAYVESESGRCEPKLSGQGLPGESASLRQAEHVCGQPHPGGL